jgi:hypothetical protein
VKVLVAVSMAVALLAAGFWVEQRASTCGAGVVQRALPHDLRADWFNGGFWLTDQKGWGVVAPPGDLELSSGEVIKVERIEGYTPERGFVAEVVLARGDRALITFEDSTRAPLRPRLVESSKLGGPDALEDDPSWRSVDPGSCLYGRFGVARALVAAGFAGLAVVAWRARPRRR